MAPDGSHLVAKFFPGTGRSYDRVVRVTTLGLDGLWKRRLLSQVPRTARAVLDLACGTGIVTFELLRRLPGARVVGVDVTDDYLAVAREKHRRRGGRVEFLLGDAETTRVVDHGPFDAIVSSYIPKYVDPDRLLGNVTPSLVPGGVLALHDFSWPPPGVVRTVWEAYFAVLDPVARRMFPEWGRVFDASLADLIRTTRWDDAFQDALPRHGFEDVRMERLTLGFSTLVTARKR